MFFPKNNNYYTICNYKDEGPNFSYNGQLCAVLAVNAIKNKDLKTNESHNAFGDFFNNDKKALSEDGLFQGVYAKEYEVFQIFLV